MLSTLSVMGQGFLHAMSPINLVMMIAGVAMGIIVGCMPGLSAAMGVALMLPLTFTMQQDTALIVLGAIYCGAIFGGSISAILIHTPGTPASAATAIEGYQMTKRGQAGKALFTACYASFWGGLLSCISLYFFAPLLAELTLKFQSAEYFWLSIFGLTIIAGVAGKSLLKGLMSGALGLLLSTIGSDPGSGMPRFMLGGNSYFYDGINVTCALIGLFSMSQVFMLAEKKITERAQASKVTDKMSLTREERRIILGKGSIEGVAGSEAANNAVTGGSLIPTLTLGIPGESVTAILMGGLIMKGLQPGRMLFNEENALVTYTFFAGFVLVQFFMLGIGLLGCRGFAQISRLSDAILIPCVTVLCVVGSYAINKLPEDVLVMFVFGILGYLMRKLDLNTAAIVLALILGPIGEKNLQNALIISDGSPKILFSSIICWVLIALCVVGILSPIFMNKLEKKAEKDASGIDPDDKKPVDLDIDND